MPEKKETNPAGDSTPSDPVATTRAQLDAVDREIVSALNRRAELAEQVARAKRDRGQSPYDPQREAEVMGQAVLGNAGPLSDETVRAVFRELVSGTRALQMSVRVAYLGPEFTFSHLAAIHHFGSSAEFLAVATISAVFEEVERHHADFGVVPMENSTDGRVTDTLDCFARSATRICGELPLRIRHCLLGHGPREGIQTVCSKPQALSQCRNWLANHLPQAQLQAVSSTSEAAELAAADPQVAAIASRQAGVHHQLPVLARDIEDSSENVTRFAVIGTESAPATGNDKTALMFEIPHQPGALADALAVFHGNQLNMTWIESFPIPGSRGRYVFFVEFVGHQAQPACRTAIESLRKKSVLLEVLGSYAQVEPIG